MNQELQPRSVEERLAIYQAFVPTVIANESKRIQANSTYAALASATAALAGSDIDIDPQVLSIIGALVGAIWFLTIRHHRQLAQAKFHAIGQIEKLLSCKPFEWEYAEYKKLRWKYIGLTRIEQILPALICIVSLGFLISDFI